MACDAYLTPISSQLKLQPQCLIFNLSKTKIPLKSPKAQTLCGLSSRPNAPSPAPAVDAVSAPVVLSKSLKAHPTSAPLQSLKTTSSAKQGTAQKPTDSPVKLKLKGMFVLTLLIGKEQRCGWLEHECNLRPKQGSLDGVKLSQVRGTTTKACYLHVEEEQRSRWLNLTPS